MLSTPKRKRICQGRVSQISLFLLYTFPWSHNFCFFCDFTFELPLKAIIWHSWLRFPFSTIITGLSWLGFALSIFTCLLPSTWLSRVNIHLFTRLGSASSAFIPRLQELVCTLLEVYSLTWPASSAKSKIKNVSSCHGNVLQGQGHCARILQSCT